jgi:hypothetical protein
MARSPRSTDHKSLKYFFHSKGVEYEAIEMVRADQRLRL